MDFKQQVMRDAETKYREMANGTAGKPLSRTPVLNSDEAYAEKRSSYCNRLNHERYSFNDAVKRIRQAKANRLEDERRQQLARAEKREAHREWRKKFFRSLVKLAVVFGALGAFAYFVVWQKWVFPNMSVKDLYTPEILQTYYRGEPNGEYYGGCYQNYTLTDCTKDGKVSATYEIICGGVYGKINLSGHIKKKSNNGTLIVEWTSQDLIYGKDIHSVADDRLEFRDGDYSSFKRNGYDFSNKIDEENLIATVDDLKKLKDSDAVFFLRNDINLSGVNWKPISGFRGVLVGGGHTIRNLGINISEWYVGANNIGFFGSLEGGVIDIKFENADINISVADVDNVGILCGELNGCAVNISASGSVSAPESDHVGGIIGMWRRFYERDKSDFHLTCSNLRNEADVNGKGDVGGVFGYIYDDSVYFQEDCVLELSKFDNKGKVTGSGDDIGGIVGRIVMHRALHISGFTNMGQVEGQKNVGGVIGSVSVAKDGFAYIKDSFSKSMDPIGKAENITID